MTDESRYRQISWAEVRDQLSRIDQQWRGAKVYGVPRGGMICAGFLRECVTVMDPAEADFILDDIVDSGRTQHHYLVYFPTTPFVSLYTRKPEDPWLVFPWEVQEDGRPEMGPEDAVVRLLEGVGEDPARDGLKDTPRRVVKAWREMTVGYSQDPKTILATLFKETTDQLIIVKDIPFHSLCEHHILPFTGRATVGYLPTDAVVGLSKIPRLVQCYARRLQVQERMTNQIAQAMHDVLGPRFVGVIVTAHHTCMSLRGVGSTGNMVTSAMLGELRDELKQEFLDLSR